MIVLPKHEYDTIQGSVWKYGGMGGGTYWDSHGNPVCLIGHWVRANGLPDADFAVLNDAHYKFQQLGLSSARSDDLVYAINLRKGLADDEARRARVGWVEYVAEGDIVRGA